jgi:hypothetical protein
VQAFQQRLFDGGPSDPVTAGEGLVEACGAGEADLARQRIVGPDAAQLHQTPRPVRPLGHGPRSHRPGDLALRLDGPSLGGSETPLVNADREVSAEDLPGMAGEALAEGFGGGTRRGDSRNSQGQAGQEDAEARQAAPQLPAGEP